MTIKMDKQNSQTPRAKIPSSRTVVEDAIAESKKHDSIWIENSQSENWEQRKSSPTELRK